MACGKILALLLLSLAAVPCRSDGHCDLEWGGHSEDSVHDARYACLECEGNNGYMCTHCGQDFKLKKTYGDAGYCESCLTWTDEYFEDWYEKIMVGSIFGIVVTLVTTVITSLPVCCGVMKESKSLKLIAIVCGIIAGVSFAIPLISGIATRGGMVDDICVKCEDGCSDAGRKELDDAFGAAGVFIAYTAGFGFVVVVLASVTMCLTCCICCPCCGPLKAAKDMQAGAAGSGPPAVQGTVIGTATPCPAS